MRTGCGECEVLLEKPEARRPFGAGFCPGWEAQSSKGPARMRAITDSIAKVGLGLGWVGVAEGEARVRVLDAMEIGGDVKKKENRSSQSVTMVSRQCQASERGSEIWGEQEKC